jgi:hypothetical protein
MPECYVSSFSASHCRPKKEITALLHRAMYCTVPSITEDNGCLLTPQMLVQSVPHCFLPSYVCKFIFVDSSIQFAAIATNDSIVTYDELERL